MFFFIFSFALYLSRLCLASHLGINVDLENNDGEISVEKATELFRSVDDYLGFESFGKVDTLRLFNYDSSVSELIDNFLNLESLKEIYLGIPNNQLQNFRVTLFSEFLLTIDSIRGRRPDILVRCIISEKPFLNGLDASDVETAIDLLQLNLPEVQVLVAFSMDTLNVTSPVSNSEFKDVFISEYSSILSKVDALGINSYPFYSVDGVSITVEDAAGEEMKILSEQVEAVQVALEREGFYLDLMVTATGWPSFGDNEFATPQSNYKYLSNVAHFAMDEEASSGLFSQLFLHELVDQPLIESDAEEAAFGIFDSLGNFKVTAPTNEPTLIPTISPTLEPTKIPSSSPTPVPTFSPSLTSSPFPTTPYPTLFPTQPTPSPSSFPTLRVTPGPSTVPVDASDVPSSFFPWTLESTQLIVVAIIGGLILIACLLCVALCCSKRKTRKERAILKQLARKKLKKDMGYIPRPGSEDLYAESGSPVAGNQLGLKTSEFSLNHYRKEKEKPNMLKATVPNSVRYRFFPDVDSQAPSLPSRPFTEVHSPNPLYPTGYYGY
eukprot:snap_masked-scaffold_56-processed-gene-1.36-mRNA-1 protein AED:1.00 eAED:1.00 QI:0/-1/0/0/-1/1/1/0/550